MVRKKYFSKAFVTVVLVLICGAVSVLWPQWRDDLRAERYQTSYAIAGKVVTSSGSPMSGVTMTLSGAASGATTTDGYGKYRFTGLANGIYTVTPGAANYSFTPTSRTVSVSGANVTGQNFKGTPIGGGSYAIAGKVVTSSGSPISGVTMTLSGAASGATTTDGYGKYSFTGLGNGNYTITPDKTGYTFIPASKTVSVNGANVTRQNFRGTT
jgi:Carboxypeptidase regulatory-like domain